MAAADRAGPARDEHGRRGTFERSCGCLVCRRHRRDRRITRSTSASAESGVKNGSAKRRRATRSVTGKSPWLEAESLPVERLEVDRAEVRARRDAAFGELGDQRSRSMAGSSRTTYTNQSTSASAASAAGRPSGARQALGRSAGHPVAPCSQLVDAGELSRPRARRTSRRCGSCSRAGRAAARSRPRLVPGSGGCASRPRAARHR